MVSGGLVAVFRQTRHPEDNGLLRQVHLFQAADQSLFYPALCGHILKYSCVGKHAGFFIFYGRECNAVIPGFIEVSFSLKIGMPGAFRFQGFHYGAEFQAGEQRMPQYVQMLM